MTKTFCSAVVLPVVLFGCLQHFQKAEKQIPYGNQNISAGRTMKEKKSKGIKK